MQLGAKKSVWLYCFLSIWLLLPKSQGGFIMEALISAAAGELVSRFISFMAQKFCDRTLNEGDHRRLEQLLLRIHTIVEEAEGRRITNRGMLLQLKMLMKGMYQGHYMLDRFKVQHAEEGKIEGQGSHRSRSFAMSTLTAAKRLRFASATTKDTLVAFGTGSLKGVLDSLEAKIQDMRGFVILLGSCPRLPRQMYCTYLFMDKCMFGRHTEKEHVINFLLCSDGTHDDCPNLGILPIIGPHRVGKKTLVQHACKDERVRGFFSKILFFKGDDLENAEFAVSLEAASGKKCLFVVEFSWNVDEAAWANFKSTFQEATGHGSKVLLIGRTQEVAKLGTAMPIWMKSLSQEEYWYYFKALAFGSMDPDEHPKLASLGMQLATELKGSFLGANILGEMLRSNPSAQFWHAILSSVRALVQEHMFSLGVHPEDLLERNVPVGFTNVSLVGAQSQGCLVYDLREADPGQEELPLPTSREVLTGVKVPAEEKFDVLVWKSRIPPYISYVVTYERQKAPRRRVGKKSRLALREVSS
ncbi:hypothetical protein BDA96_05G049000 [Sorghum bicolor]|uniref:Rx N-terminal domain-containing protein n=2 Tax=Sorghum bicolor TaxID=4558 RepID=A0A921QXE2_SORBI|nr:hypothetical protein BDA96_05G049000 [Sorghum bicolor]